MRNKTKFKAILTASIFSCTLFLNTNFSVNAQPIKQRLSGNNRYETCKAIVDKGWSKSDYAVIATGASYPDALSAATVAKKYNAPLILTQSNKLDVNAKYELTRLKVKNVFIIGGKGAINSNVESTIKNMGIKVTRIAGSDRFSTSVKIAENLGKSNEIFVTTGLDFADALSVSSIAAQKGMPIILVNKNAIDKSVVEYLKNNKISKAYVIGGNDVISDNVVKKIPNAERIIGSTKYDRNVAVLNKFSNNINLNDVYITTGTNFPDALAGSALAAMGSSPIVLVEDNINSNTSKYVKGNLDKIKNFKILGGTGAITDNLMNKLMNNKDNNDKKDKDKEVKKGTGVRSNPISLWGKQKMTFQNVLFEEPRNIELQLLEIDTGDKANSIVAHENELNTVPNKDQEWVLMKFKFKYVSGPEEPLQASDVINSQSLYSKDGAQINTLDTASFCEERSGKGIYGVELYPNGEATFWYGVIQKKSSNPYPLIRIQTGFDNKRYKTSYTWFTTEPTKK